MWRYFVLIPHRSIRLVGCRSDLLSLHRLPHLRQRHSPLEEFGPGPAASSSGRNGDFPQRRTRSDSVPRRRLSVTQLPLLATLFHRRLRVGFSRI